MPLDLPSNDSHGPTQSSSSSLQLPPAFTPPDPAVATESSIARFFEMIRASPEARRGSEESNQHSYEPLLADYLSRYNPQLRHSTHRRSHGETSSNARFHVPEWRRVSYFPRDSMIQPPMPLQRSVASLGLLRRELEGDITFMSPEISGLERELEDLVGRFAQEEPHPRNHYRHSSMSMSPRILDSGGLLSSSDQQSEGHPCAKLEDGLLFLEMRRSSKLRIPAHVQEPLLNRPFVTESSWLRPGALFRGSQQILADSPRVTPYLGQLTEDQAHQLKGWRVDLVIDRIDYSNMIMEGIMSAYVQPHPEAEGFSSYWTGEVAFSGFVLSDSSS